MGIQKTSALLVMMLLCSAMTVPARLLGTKGEKQCSTVHKLFE